MFNYSYRKESILKWNHLYFNLCLLPLGLALGNTEKVCLCLVNPASLSHQMYIYYNTSPVSFYFCKLNSPNSLNLFLYIRWPRPLITALCWTHSTISTSLCHWRASNWAWHARRASPNMSQGEGPLSLTC